MSEHRTTIRPVPVPEWVLHWPECSCGWQGYILRTHAMASDQAAEHLADEHPDHTEDTAAQPALFDL